MKVITLQGPELQLIKQKVLKTRSKTKDKSYQQGYNIFVESFFFAAWVLDSKDEEGFATESCMENAIE